MSTAQDLRTKIAKLDAQIASGVEETVVDGTKVKRSITAMQKERTQLRRRLKRLTNGASSFARPVDLGGF